MNAQVDTYEFLLQCFAIVAVSSSLIIWTKITHLLSFGEYYLALLTKIREKLVEERRRIVPKGFFCKTMHHQSNRTLPWINFSDLEFELVQHPPHSPNLAPSDYLPFS